MSSNSAAGGKYASCEWGESGGKSTAKSTRKQKKVNTFTGKHDSFWKKLRKGFASGGLQQPKITVKIT